MWKVYSSSVSHGRLCAVSLAAVRQSSACKVAFPVARKFSLSHHHVLYSEKVSSRQLFTSTKKSNFPEVQLQTAEELINWDEFPIPGTSAAAEAAGLVQGTVTEKRVWIEDEIFHSEELRAWNPGRGDANVVTMGALDSPDSADARGGVSTEEIGRIAEGFLGRERFSTQHSLSHNFGQFRDVILLFLFKVSDAHHPVTYLTKILEQEPQEGLGENQRNPYPLWRSMTLKLVAEMYGFPQEIQRLPPQVHTAIREKHDRLAKIAEIVWIAHQLHRRVLDFSVNMPETKRLKSVNVGGQLLQTVVEEVECAEELHRANKATTLVGDLLLTQKCAHLAALKSPIVLELICNSLADYCEGEFDNGVVARGPEYFTYEAWLRRSEAGLGSLLGHCMYSALLFSGHGHEEREQAYKIGSMIGVLNQAYDEVRLLRRRDEHGTMWTDWGVLPVIYQVERDPGLLQKSHSEILYAMADTPSTVRRSWETFEFIKKQTVQILTNCTDVRHPVPRDILLNWAQSLEPLQS